MALDLFKGQGVTFFATASHQTQLLPNKIGFDGKVV